MPIPTTGNDIIDTLLDQATSKGFSIEAHPAAWMLRDPEGNELAFDPGYGKAIPVLERVLRDALTHSTLCPAVCGE